MNKNIGANRKQDIFRNRASCAKALWQKWGLSIQGSFYKTSMTAVEGTHFWGPLISCSPEKKNQEIVKDDNTNL